MDKENNRISNVDNIFRKITELLPTIYDDVNKETYFITNSNRDEIISAEESEVEAIANLFDQLYGIGTCCVGRYENDDIGIETEDVLLNGMYYVAIN